MTGFFDWIEEGNSYIQAVYAENADESRKDMLTEKVFQCYITNNAAEKMHCWCR